MEVTTTALKHCDLVKVSGRIDSYTAQQLSDAIKTILAARRYKIICDMGQVDYMSSAGLRVLAATQKACRRYNRGEIILCNVSERVCEAIELGGFAPLFKFFNDIVMAVGQF